MVETIRREKLDAQYRAVNTCLNLLKQCDIPKKVKLHVELQLMQIKRLLLDDGIPRPLTPHSPESDIFDTLVTDMKALKDETMETDCLVNVIGDIRCVLAGLGGTPATETSK